MSDTLWYFIGGFSCCGLLFYVVDRLKARP